MTVLPLFPWAVQLPFRFDCSASYGDSFSEGESNFFFVLFFFWFFFFLLYLTFSFIVHHFSKGVSAYTDMLGRGVAGRGGGGGIRSIFLPVASSSIQTTCTAAGVEVINSTDSSFNRFKRHFMRTATPPAHPLHISPDGPLVQSPNFYI